MVQCTTLIDDGFVDGYTCSLQLYILYSPIMSFPLNFLGLFFLPVFLLHSLQNVTGIYYYI